MAHWRPGAMPGHSDSTALGWGVASPLSRPKAWSGLRTPGSRDSPK